VLFYINDSLYFIDEIPEYSYNFNTDGLSYGNYDIKAIAKDKYNSQTEVVISLKLNINPQVHIVKPENNTIFDIGDNIDMLVEASDNNIKGDNKSIKKVEFYLDNNFLYYDDSSPYEYSLNTNGYEAKNYIIKAIVVDNDDAIENSTVNIRLNQPPVCSVSYPINGLEINRDEIDITVNASDDREIQKIDYYIDSILVGTSYSSPFNYIWNAKEENIGSHTIKAVAVDDDNSVTESDEISIMLLNSLPVCEVINPQNGDNYQQGDVISFTAEAGDSDGTVANVKFYINDILKSTDTDPPYSYEWVTNNISIASYNLKIKVEDNDGGLSDDQLNINIIENLPPVCSITSPENNQHFTRLDNINIQVNASDEAKSVDTVTFYIDNDSIGVDNNMPYIFNINLNDQSLGNHTLKVVAKDNHGELDSAKIEIVVDNIPPVCEITNSEDGEIIFIGTTVEITADATDEDGTIAEVAMYIDGDLIATDYVVPYSVEWNTESYDLGSHIIKIVAKDNDGSEIEKTIEIELNVLTWSNKFGDYEPQSAASVQQTNDGGYIVAGYSKRYSKDDYWLIKTDQGGNEVWSKTFGGIELDQAKSVQQTTDGGYIIAGYTKSFGAGSYDSWLIKTDENGDELWNKTYGGNKNR